MRLRADLTLNGEQRSLVFVAGPNDKPEHLALKLAAYLLFWEQQPIAGASTKLPALSNYEFLPDLLALDAAGDITLWVECGSATLHSLGKLVSRIPSGRGRIVVLKTQPREAERLREEVLKELGPEKSKRVEILSFPRDAFKEWAAAVGEQAEGFGDASERALNLVVNEHPFSVDLLAC
jgi:hypothetical protein